MKITFKQFFTTKEGLKKAIYTVEGTKEELAAYKTAQGAYYAQDTKTNKPLFFSSKLMGQSADVQMSAKGNLFVPETYAEGAAGMELQEQIRVAQIFKSRMVI